MHVDDIFHFDLDIREVFMRQSHEEGLYCRLVLTLSNPLGCITVIKWDLEKSNFYKVLIKNKLMSSLSENFREFDLRVLLGL